VTGNTFVDILYGRTNAPNGNPPMGLDPWDPTVVSDQIAGDPKNRHEHC